MMKYLLLVFILILTIVSASGCHRQGHSLCGSATYDGQPIPSGSIMFEPDESKGTRGAGGAADIVNGIYRTRENADIKNGFYRITVYGYDPSLNTKNSMDAIMSIFTPYTTEFEVTTEKQTIDIDVPKNDGQSSPIKHNVTY